METIGGRGYVSEPVDVLDARRVRRAFERAATHYAEHDMLQRLVREELADRLDWLSLDPRNILDLGSGPGCLAGQLLKRYPTATTVALDWSWAMLARGRQDVPGLLCLGADARALPLRWGSFDLVVSSLLLQWIERPLEVLTAVRRILRPRGAFLFATLGPDSLIELRRLFARVDSAEHVLPFLDMHVVGDLLIAAGLSEPVLDVTHIELLYPDFLALVRSLRGLGATNHRRDRPRSLGGRAYWARLQAAAEETSRQTEGFPVTFEVIHGVAWAPIVHVKDESTR